MQVLTAYVREHAPLAEVVPPPTPPSGFSDEPFPGPDADVQAALTVIARRTRHPHEDRIDLRRADLTGAWLTDAKLSGANLIRTRLTGAQLRLAKLDNANLVGADLTGADLIGADLTNADVAGAIGIKDALTPEQLNQTKVRTKINPPHRPPRP